MTNEILGTWIWLHGIIRANIPNSCACTWQRDPLMQTEIVQRMTLKAPIPKVQLSCSTEQEIYLGPCIAFGCKVRAENSHTMASQIPYLVIIYRSIYLVSTAIVWDIFKPCQNIKYFCLVIICTWINVGEITVRRIYRVFCFLLFKSLKILRQES